MKNTLLIYGIFLGILACLLKMTEYWFWIKLNAFDVYIVLIAVIFLGVGVWLGVRLQQKSKEKQELKPENTEGSSDVGFGMSDVGNNQTDIQNTEGSFVINGINANALIQSNISKREHEVLQLIAKGMSNQEIADVLFISQNTIKTHTSRLFEKLEVKNRTHAIIKAKELGIIVS